jgi:hypothetical protein
MSINGFMGRPFPVAAGVREGDPLSPSLFAIAMEPLAATLRARLQGISLNTGVVRTILFADDLSFAARNAQDLTAGPHTIETYEEASGGKISTKKSFLAPVHRANVPPSVRAVLPPGFSVRLGPFHLFSVQVGPDVNSQRVWSSIVDC